MQLTPRQRLFLINIHRIAAGRLGYLVATDPAEWLGRKLTSADRVKAHRTYSQLERRGLVQRHPWCEGSNRRFRTAALSLTPTGEAVAASLGAPAEAPGEVSHAIQTTAAPSGAMLTPAYQPPVVTSATPPTPVITTGDDQLSRQSDFSRRKQSEVAEIGPLPEAVLTPRITNLDDALLYLAALEPEEPPYTVAVNDELPVSRATIDELAAAGLLTIHEAEGAVSVAVTIAGTLRTFAIENDRAASAKSITASADTSSAAA